MSEWEDFCEHMGVNPGCPDDYDRLMDMVQKGGRGTCYNLVTDGPEDESEELVELRFSTFREAAEWAKRNKGRSFTRSADGNYFVATGGAVDAPAKGDVPAFCRGDYLPPGANWIPGTFPATAEEEELSSLDYAHKRRTFWPRLRRLAPSVARLEVMGNYSFSLSAASFRFRENTLCELDELRALLAEVNDRTIRWYTTQREYRLRIIAEREKSGYTKAPWLKEQDEKFKRYEKIPDEVLFWEKALSLVEDEQYWRTENFA